ncbi:MAG: FecR domain-containing protein [Kiritimatiellae bacterium]|nr:FecR domain-containing protein [Kiritimatiellia bacterium]
MQKLSEELWTKFVDDRLTEDETAQLAARLEADAAGKDGYLADLDIARLLRQLKVTDDEFLRSLQERLKAETDGPEILRRVDDELDRLPGAASRPLRFRRLIKTLALPLAAAAVLLALLWGRDRWDLQGGRAGNTAQVVWTQGDVQRVRDQETRVLTTGMHVRPGDRIRTDGAGTLGLRFPDGSTVLVKENTECELIAQQRGKRLTLAAGQLRIDAAKQPAGFPMRLSTPHAEATVLGTKLNLGVRRATTRLHVEEGAVELMEHEHNETVTVRGGQYAVAQAGAVTVPVPMPGNRGVYRFDFEDGARPAFWVRGKIAEEPKREGSRFCLVGEQGRAAHVGSQVVMNRSSRTGLFPYAPELVLRFLCWAPPQAKKMTVQVWNGTQQQNFRLQVHDFERGSWSSIEIPIRTLAPRRPERSDTFHPDDILMNIAIYLTKGQGDLFVDDVEIVREGE